MQISKFRIPVAIAAVLSCSALSYATADEVTTTSTTVESRSSSLPGGVVYFRTVQPTLLVTTLEGRRRNLEKQLDDACARGEISPTQSETLKAELRRIAAQTSTNNISYSDAVMLAEDLDLLSTQYGTFVTTAPAYVPIINGSHFTIYNGQVVELDDLSVRRVDLEARVTKDYLRGRLSSSQANQLRTKLQNIGNEAAIYRADGNLNDKEARHLYTEFDHVASQLEGWAGKDI